MAEAALDEAINAREELEFALDYLRRELDSLIRRSDVANNYLTTSLAHGESVKARIAAVRHILTTSVRATSNTRKYFEIGSKCELEKSRK